MTARTPERTDRSWRPAADAGATTATKPLTPPRDRRTIGADHRSDVFGDQLQLCSLPARIVPLAAGFFSEVCEHSGIYALRFL